MNDTPEEPADLSGLEAKDSSSKAQSAEAEQASKAILQALTDLKAENADLRDRNLRIIAEMENFRRRAERDKSESVKYAASEFGRDMISVADNLRRAIEAVSKDASEQSPAVKTLLEGVEATERELFKTFERHGITRFDPLGEKFDPHNHEAVVKVDVPNVSGRRNRAGSAGWLQDCGPGSETCHRHPCQGRRPHQERPRRSVGGHVQARRRV